MIRSRLSAIAVVAVIGVSACGGSGSDATAARQQEVEARGATVMPFDQNRTTHVFHSTATGGVQRVVADHPDDARQIKLIRAHLRKEAIRFAAGNFTDPMAIHGMTMPGLDALRHGAAQVHVEYATITSGAKIIYTTSKPRLVIALHDWFDAQLMDHGSDAHG